MRNVSTDLALVDKVGQYALSLVRVDVLHAHVLQHNQKSLDRHLERAQQQVDLLEEIPNAGRCMYFGSQVVKKFGYLYVMILSFSRMR